MTKKEEKSIIEKRKENVRKMPMTRRHLSILLLFSLLLTMLASCADAPRSSAMALSKADDLLAEWNEEDVRYCNYFYSASYDKESKTYTVTMRAYIESAVMLSRAIVQESAELVWGTLHDECFANRREIHLALRICDYKGNCRFTYDGKILSQA